MPPSPAKKPVDVVDIDSSNDKDNAAVAKPVTKTSKSPQEKGDASALAAVPVDPQFVKQKKLDCRSFWQAGAYQLGPSSFAPIKSELEHARVHPKFLNSNATSYKWAFRECPFRV